MPLALEQIPDPAEDAAEPSSPAGTAAALRAAPTSGTAAGFLAAPAPTTSANDAAGSAADPAASPHEAAGFVAAPAAPPSTSGSAVMGILLVFLSSLLFSMSNLAVHLLSRQPEPRVPPLQTISVRFLLQFLLTCASLVLLRCRSGRLWEAQTWMGRPGNWWKLLLRGGWGLVGVFGWFTLLSVMSFSDATAIIFTNVCLTGLFAHWLLGEAFTWVDASAGLLGLLGVLLVAQPASLFGSAGQAPIAPLTVALALATACASAMAYVSARIIGPGEDPLVITLWFGGLGALAAPLLLLATEGGPVATPPSTPAFWLQLAAGVLGFAGQVGLNAGLSMAPVGPSSVMRYSELVLALVVQATLLGESPNALKWAGSLLVCSTLVSTLHRARAKAAAEQAAKAGPQLTLEEDRRRYYAF